MYGLFQAGIVSHTSLKEHLSPFRYNFVTITPGLWRHTTNSVKFILVVDNFGIKYQ